MNASDPTGSELETALRKSASDKPIMFDHERLDVYQLQLDFISWVTPLLDEARNTAASRVREVCEQLDRASLSSLLNTAEGNGKRQRQVRAKFFDDARGSATECAGCLDALLAKQVFTEAKILKGKAMLLRIVSMLCRLVERFDTAINQFHEASVEYRISAESARKIGNVSRTRTRTRTRTKNK